jgi:hypothetical protein
MPYDDSNFQKWQLFFKDCTAPQSFIDWGFYSLIASSLERRINIQSDMLSLYPNLYVVLVGPPATGKGLVVRQVTSIMSRWKLEDMRLFKGGQKDTTGNNEAKALEAEMEDAKKKKLVPNTGDMALFPTLANCTTFRALTNEIASSYRRINYRVWNTETNKFDLKTYGHSSNCFVLEELASLFQEKKTDLVNFLHEAYDCGDYKNKTMHEGTDIIRRCCLNIFAGTNLEFMEEIFGNGLMNMGFGSRTMFIFQARPRFRKMWVSDFTQEQKQAYEDVCKHVFNLSTLYGTATFSPEAKEFLRAWWEDNFIRTNTSEKLEAYYGRKNIHIKKLACVMHFAEVKFDPNDPESCPMEISTDSCKRALEFLEIAEKTMHLALVVDAKNPLYKLSRKIDKFVRNMKPKQEATFKQIVEECWDDGNMEQIKEATDHLAYVGRLEQEGNIYRPATTSMDVQLQ